MEKLTYKIESQVQEYHWWFAGRRTLIKRTIEKMAIPNTAPAIDLGTGTGSNLKLLKDIGFSNVIGVDFSEEAIRYCGEKGLGTVELGDICNLHFNDNTFQLVLATDIIEHLDDDAKGLSEITRILAPGGKLIITVPAFQFLWGVQDDLGNHKRRYRLNRLKNQIHQSGLDCHESFYFNYILFMPTWIARKLIKFFRIKVKNENLINTSMLNRILKTLFTWDVLSAHFIRPPFGVSIMIVAEKAENEERLLI